MIIVVFCRGFGFGLETVRLYVCSVLEKGMVVGVFVLSWWFSKVFGGLFYRG